MTLIQTSIWNGLAVVVRTVTALFLNKILAIYVGPAGYAVIGQFQNVLSTLTVFVTGGMTNGITKYTAEHFEDEELQQRVWRTASVITAIGSCVAATILIPFRNYLADKLLLDRSLSGIFVWLAISLFFLGLNSLLLAILRGKKEVRRYVIVNIFGSLLSLLLTGVLAWRFGLYGVLVALSVNQSATFFVALQQCWRSTWFRISAFWGQFDVASAKKLAQFALMGATTAIVGPVFQILIRNHLRHKFGWDYAGCWEAMWRISTIYLSLVTTTLSLYYLPRISEIRDHMELRREIYYVFRLVVPATAFASFMLFLFRHMIIRVLFTAKFEPMDQLFGLQMMGDVVKIASWVLAFVMVGRAMTIAFVVTEIVSAVVFWLLTIVLTEYAGFAGVSLAHLANHCLYLGMMYVLIMTKTGGRISGALRRLASGAR